MINHTHALKSGLTLFLILFISFNGFNQTTGLIVDVAGGVGSAVLDPNGDGYTSATTSGFGADDKVNSEIPYTTLIPAGSEPNSDVSNGPDCGFSDFVESFVGGQDPVLSYLDASNNWLFRIRMASIAPNSKSYSILIDVDNLFGTDDPTYSATNPGFEIEIVLATNFGVTMYNIDGGCPGCEVSYGTDHYQKSIAGSAICNPYNYFLDFYIDFDDLMSDPCFASFGITPSTIMRYALVDNMAADKSSICYPNSTSDLGGVGECDNLEDCYTDIITSQPSCSPSNLGSCPPLSDCPAIFPVSAGDASISGTSIEAEFTLITVYINGSSIPETGTVDASGNWIVTLGGTVIVNGDVITATATAPGESESNTLCNEQIVVSCLGAPDVPPVVSNATGKNFCGTGIAGYSINVYNPSGVIEVSNPTPAVSSYLPVTVGGDWVWKCTGNTGGCNSGSGVDCIDEGGYMITQASPDGCESYPAFACVSKGGGYTPNTSITPTIVPASVVPGATSVDVTVSFLTPPSPQSGYVYLFLDGLYLTTSPIINVAGTISVSCPALPSCGTLTAMFIQSAASGDHDCFSSASSGVSLTGVSDTPVIGGPLCSSVPLTSISGTSTEEDGTAIVLFEDGSFVGSTTVVNGAWTISGSFGPGTTMTATATNTAGCETVSPLSSGVNIETQSTTTVDIIPVSVIEGTTTVSGTASSFTAGDIVTLYIDGYPVFQDLSETILATGVVDGSGNWTISTIYSGALYAGGILTATVYSVGQCESNLNDPTPIVCVPPLIGLVVNPDNAVVCEGSFVANAQISSSTEGVIYQLYDNNLSANSGSAVLGTGGTVNLSSAVLNANTTLTVLTIKSPFGACSDVLTESIDVTVNALPDPALVVSGPAPICPGESGDVTVDLSESGFIYQLRDDADDSSVGSSVSGTGGTIVLPTGNLTSTTTFNIIGTGVSPSNCNAELSTLITVTVSCPLPVEMVNFRVNCEGKSNVISWETISELNNDYFALEKSFDGSDFRLFKIIDGMGISNELQHYEVRDDDVNNSEIVYYRVRQVDIDGKEEYSNIISFDDCGLNIMNMYFDRLSSEIVIDFDVQSIMNADVVLSDVVGRLYLSENILLEPNKNQVRIRANNLAKNAMYILNVSSEDFFNTKRIYLND